MEPLVTIAIPDLAGPAARTATLDSLARHTPELHEVVLLVEEARRQKVSSWPDNQALRQILVPVPFGAPAALNRLLATGRPPGSPLLYTKHEHQPEYSRGDSGGRPTPYILLLESGTIVTAGWLGRL